MRTQNSRRTTTFLASLVVILCLAAAAAVFWVQSADRTRDQPSQPSPHAINQDAGS